MTAAPVENFRLTVALEYAERGWQVFPCQWPRIAPVGKATCSCGKSDCTNIGKHPTTFNGHLEATDDPEKIRHWWERWPAANIGVAMGAASGIIALDMDPRSGGEASLAELEAEIGELPPTWQVRTGGGGSHYFFAHPGEKVWSGSGLKGWIKKMGLDVKGDGGYVVAAPSLHASGNRYRWEEGREPVDLDVAPMPAKLLGLMRARNLRTPQPAASSAPARQRDDTATHWLGKALAKATSGNRNDTGYWLACQLRDANVTETEAAATMRDYCRRVPQDGTAYTEREAEATCRSAYGEPRREPAKGLGTTERVMKVVAQAKPIAKAATAADELRTFYSDVAARKIYSVPFPWPVMSRLAAALLPGTVTCITGDPGVGKTFVILQCLQDWYSNGHDAAVFFIEKNRLFHTRRLLAQLEHDWCFKDFDWAQKPGSMERIGVAMARNAEIINDLAKRIASEPDGRVTLDDVLEWITREAAKGARVIVVDPISAAAVGKDRWTADQDFVHAAQKVMGAYGASLILVTHSKKGNRIGTASGHDMSGGAAYFRFSDSTIWIHKAKKPRKVRYLAKAGNGTQQAVGKFSIFLQLQKTREGAGDGAEIAFALSDGGIYTEQGLVIADAKGQDDDEPTAEDL